MFPLLVKTLPGDSLELVVTPTQTIDELAQCVAASLRVDRASVRICFRGHLCSLPTQTLREAGIGTENFVVALVSRQYQLIWIPAAGPHT